jgi:hypothetical protein
VTNPNFTHEVWKGLTGGLSRPGAGSILSNLYAIVSVVGG